MKGLLFKYTQFYYQKANLYCISYATLLLLLFYFPDAI
jgi:hypothetical protein